MKRILLLTIRIYWQLPKLRQSRSCLFKETCSRHVYRITKDLGFLLGLKALISRIRQCNSNHTIFYDKKGLLKIELADGYCIHEKEISSNLFNHL